MSVLVVNFGSQYSKLIVKQIRAEGVFADFIDCDHENLLEEAKKFKAIVISGSPKSVSEGEDEHLIKNLISLEKPILGICYGMQIIHKVLGGEMEYGKTSEFGTKEVNVICGHPLVDGIPTSFTTWMSHHDSVAKLAPDFISIAQTSKTFAIAANDKKHIYTTLFHPEVEHCKYGSQLISNFLFLICKLDKDWKLSDIAKEKIEAIDNKYGHGGVLLALSGGVDSSVVAKLLKSTQLNMSLLFINTGLLRMSQTNLIIDYFKNEFGDKLHILDEKSKFLNALKGITNPEEKRKIVGRVFSEIFNKFLQDHPEIKFLAQGTIQSDIIESGKVNKTHKIKTHHNTIAEMQKFTLIEPLSDLFKSEVRNLGLLLGLPEFIVQAQPFPGPGYSIRIEGEVTEEKLNLLQKVDKILIDMLQEKGLYSKTSQTFAVLLNSKSIGVSGDRQKSGSVVAIRSVKTTNFMTAEVSDLPLEALIEISTEIVNQVEEISRVVYDLTTKPPATIEWE